ncbi:uncharacterized protein VTP21DRAFT_9399 [Calcarisporiella thermophila]|uniref:uncharacterized protein n=1 Tax=Calcarisporiella thermophila TaxID=911321 RepID=UPI003742805B
MLRTAALIRPLRYAARPTTCLLCHHHRPISTSLARDTSTQPSDPVTTSAFSEIFSGILSTNQYFLEQLHHSAHLPWWASIVAATVILRSTLTFPIAISQQKYVARMNGIAPVIKSWTETLKHTVTRDAKKRGLTYEEYESLLQKEYREKIKSLYRAHKCEPWRVLLLPWVQLPLFLSMSFTLRSMTSFPIPWLPLPTSPVDGLQTGGIAWFTDLTQPDHTWLLPMAIGITNVINVEWNAWLKREVDLTNRQRILRGLARGLAIVSAPIATQLPTALCLYWLTSSTFSVGQNIAFRVPAFRRILGLSAIK